MTDASAPVIPLAWAADQALARLARDTGSAAIAALDGATLLGERAMLSGLSIGGCVSAGGGCRLYAARDDRIALNLARPSDREMLPALFEDDTLDPRDHEAVGCRIADRQATALVARGRLMGLAIAAMHEEHPVPAKAWTPLAHGPPAPARPRDRPRVLDLTALWAGPLAGHLLWLAGCEVIKVESPARPDSMRAGAADFHALLNQGKANVALDLRDRADRQALVALIADADIVLEAARPRALAQWGISADAIVRATPGLVWLTITAHGATGDAANWVGFGDDVGVAAGLSAELHTITGRSGFVGDAIADPLTGIHAAMLGWTFWQRGDGGRYGMAMRDVAASCLHRERARDPQAWLRTLRSWATGEGAAFAPVRRRLVEPADAPRSAAARWSATAAPC